MYIYIFGYIYIYIYGYIDRLDRNIFNCLGYIIPKKSFWMAFL